MIFGRSFMTLLFVVFMFFYQQLLANDTYDLEEFREYHKTNSKLPSNQQQKRTGQSPLENIRIGFVRLDLASEDVSGDGRLEICEGYEVDEQDFKRLIEFFFEYANMGDPQYRKVSNVSGHSNPEFMQSKAADAIAVKPIRSAVSVSSLASVN
ncbi:hypothetical protein [Endozoicomonas sp. SESOKO2]|uniref:hypothetical protein n=1 Tax=Endozoicomonas sp. SESOKO2 TaxID=2828743 RepID=UPI002149760F|nr:hypothetical protein [Endozoicomonas sp. SESOKO2]